MKSLNKVMSAVNSLSVRRLISAAVSAALSVSLSAAGTALPVSGDADSVMVPLSLEEHWLYDYSEDSVSLVQYEYDLIEVPDVRKSEYPGLAGALSALNESVTRESSDSFSFMVTNAREMYSDSPDYFNEFYEDREAQVKRADSEITSILYINEGYYGGAHGSSSFESYNYDTGTGAELKLTDVVSDTEALKQAAYEQLKVLYPDLYSPDLFLSIDPQDYIWTVGYDCLTVYLPVYTIGSYAEGEQILPVSFGRYSELFTDTALRTPENYSLMLGGNYAWEGHDLDGDGTVTEIGVFGSRYEDGGYTAYTIAVGEERVETEDYFFEMTSFLVRSGGRVYLDLLLSRENDYRELSVYDITDGTPTALIAMPYGWRSFYNESTSGFGYDIPTDPGSFLLETRTDICGTLSLSGEFAVGGDGIPAMTSPWLDYEGAASLVAKTAFSADLVDEQGNASGTLSVSPGMTLTPERTDGESWVDLRTEDGVLARMTADRTSWPILLNGVSQDDLFEEIFYAG